MSTPASKTKPGKITPRVNLTARFAALRACLQNNGITLPKRTPGQGAAPTAGLLGAGAALPKGVTKAQYEAAVKKCGGVPHVKADRAPFNSPAVKQALAKFASCMHENGVKVSAPNTSGNGPVFSGKGLNTSSPRFQAAAAKCSAALQGAFRASPGGGPPAGSPPKAP